MTKWYPEDVVLGAVVFVLCSSVFVLCVVIPVAYLMEGCS